VLEPTNTLTRAGCGVTANRSITPRSRLSEGLHDGLYPGHGWHFNMFKAVVQLIITTCFIQSFKRLFSDFVCGAVQRHLWRSHMKWHRRLVITLPGPHQLTTTSTHAT